MLTGGELRKTERTRFASYIWTMKGIGVTVRFCLVKWKELTTEMEKTEVGKSGESLVKPIISEGGQ